MALTGVVVKKQLEKWCPNIQRYIQQPIDDLSFNSLNWNEYLASRNMVWISRQIQYDRTSETEWQNEIFIHQQQMRAGGMNNLRHGNDFMPGLLNDQITPLPNMSHFSTEKIHTDAHIIHHLFACNRRLVHFLLISSQSI